MRLDAFLVADAVSAPPDGKFYLHGGGITRFTLPALPFTVPQIGIFIRLEVSDEELPKRHAFGLSFLNPDGVPVIPPHRIEAGPLDDVHLYPGEGRYVALALNLGGVTFTRPGPHRLEFHVDGELARSESLAVVALSAEELQARGYSLSG